MTTWLNLVNIMPSKISQTEEQIWHTISLICGIENKTKSSKQRADWQLQAWRGGGMDEGGEKVQTCIHKM